MRLTPDQRHSLVNAVRRGINKNIVARVFDTTVKTVTKWCKRAFHRGREYFRDKPRKAKESKVTVEVEVSILALRNSFEWGTARIQQGLYCLPEYAREAIDCVQGVKLSRAAINNILKKHDINGYNHNGKSWKFFRAERPDELWQLDIKGPFILQGKKYWFVVCIDDYSRYLILAEQFDHDLKVEEIEWVLMPHIQEHHPKSILTDNKPFKEEWDGWCRNNGIEPLHAHPHYPQDKGKVERAIRNVSEEFIYIMKRFPEWIKGRIRDYQEWFNNKRYHRGINDYPINLYRGS